MLQPCKCPVLSMETIAVAKGRSCQKLATVMELEGNYYKLMLIGNSGVGKTVLLNRFFGEEFHPEFVSTVGIDYRIKSVTRSAAKMPIGYSSETRLKCDLTLEGLRMRSVW